MNIMKKNPIPLYGLDLRDNPERAKYFLQTNGNPFRSIGIDPSGAVARSLGVYGTPESFLIDRNGVIRYIHLGIMTEEIWETEVRPLVEQYSKPE